MTIATNDPFVGRTPRSEIDRRAIGVVGQLLLAGIWLESQLKNAPRPRISWSEPPNGSGSDARALPANVVPITRSRNEKR
jgi:hypothetical protein